MNNAGKKGDHYAQYVRFIVRMFKLLNDDPDLESAEAEAAREEVEGFWYEFSELQKKRLRGLSLDLKSILGERPCIAVGPIHDLPGIHEIRFEPDADERLELIRKHQDELPAALVSSIRGEIWTEWGCPEAAAEFFQDAWRLDKSNQLAQSMMLLSLHDRK